MKLSSEIRNLPIVSIAEGEEVGNVKDFIIDPARRAIVAIVVEDKQWFKGAKVVSFSLIHSIGNFAITIENSSSVVELSEMDELCSLIERNIVIVGSKVITKSGRMIGFIKEYSVDAKTGRLLGLELTSNSQIPEPDKNVIPSDAIVTIGKDVIIVEDDVESRLMEGHEDALGVVSEEVPLPPKRKKETKPVDPTVLPKEMEEPMAVEATVEPEYEKVKVEPEKPEEMETKEGESLSEIFERRQIRYMMGKKVSKTIEADDGSMIAKKGEIINDDIIKKAKKSGKFLELSMSIEIED